MWIQSLKRIVLIIIVFCTIMLQTTPSFGLAVDQVPNPKNAHQDNWVVDRADIISAEIEADINRQLADLKRAKSIEMAVVTVPDISPEASIEDYANKLFNRWGIGSSSTDKGLLFLWSPGDRKVRFEVGYGLEEQFPDITMKTVLEKKVTPFLRNETQFSNDKAVLNAVQSIAGPPLTEPSNTAVFWCLVGFVLLVMYLVFDAIQSSKRKRKGKGSGSYYGDYDSSGGSWGGRDSGGGGASDDY